MNKTIEMSNRALEEEWTPAPTAPDPRMADAAHEMADVLLMLQAEHGGDCTCDLCGSAATALYHYSMLFDTPT